MIRTLDTYFDKGSSEKADPPKKVERMQELWTEKYCPKKVSEIVGHGKPIEEMLDWARDFKKSGKRAVLLHGPTGNGKTCSVYAIAKELDYEVIETNASDFRTKDAIKQQIGHAARHSSLLYQEHDPPRVSQKVLQVSDVLYYLSILIKYLSPLKIS